MRLRRRDTTRVELSAGPASIEDDDLSPLGHWWVPRLVSAGLWLLVVLSVVFAGIAWARPVASSPTVTVIEGGEARWDVAGFAELFVAQFVDAGDGDELSLALFMGGQSPPALAGAESGGWFASSTTTTAVVETVRDRWRVTVAAGLLRRGSASASYVSMGVRFFEVEIVATETGLSATTLPWIAPPPTAGKLVNDGWGRAEVADSGDALVDTAERFLTALLTGNGELGRYAAPGSALRAVPATFDAVSVERIAQRSDAEGARWARTWVRAVSGESVLWLTYDLQVTERDGRWEIAAMGPEPVVTESPEIPVASTTALVVESTTQGS